MCICESWENSPDNALLAWDDKVIFQHDRTDRTGRGLLMYVDCFFGPHCVERPQLGLIEASIEVQTLFIKKPTYRNIALYVDPQWG